MLTLMMTDRGHWTGQQMSQTTIAPTIVYVVVRARKLWKQRECKIIDSNLHWHSKCYYKLDRSMVVTHFQRWYWWLNDEWHRHRHKHNVMFHSTFYVCHFSILPSCIGTINISLKWKNNNQSFSSGIRIEFLDTELQVLSHLTWQKIN